MQSGWLRASQRALDADASTALLPVQTHPRADVAPLPTGEGATLGTRPAVSRSRTRSAPVRGSASWCSRRAATGPRGPSPRSRLARSATTVTVVARGGDTVQGGAAGGVGRRRVDTAPDVRHASRPTVPDLRAPSTTGVLAHELQSASTSWPTSTSSASPRSIRSAATGEGITGHDHEMTDYSPDGAAERAEHDRATLARARRRRPGDHDRRRPRRRRGDAGTTRARARRARRRRAPARPPRARQPGADACAWPST